LVAGDDDFIMISVPGKSSTPDRELSQLAAGGRTKNGWDDFKAGLSGDVLRIEDNPRSVREMPFAKMETTR
jgi:hypothetical protein